jgi:ubiquinone/menaquinone biosynthesis C-methylase UbiE
MPLERDPEGNEIRSIREFLNLSDAYVLEIGCGDGRLTRLYAPIAAAVMGIDPDLDRLTGALQMPPPHARFAQASALALPFAASVFDSAILAWSL